MKKLILIGLAVLLALALVTCDYTPNAIEDEEFTNVIFGPDKVTILFDDVVPKSDARTLTQPLAAMGLDFFEVVFMGGTTGTPTIVRATWEYGRSVVVKDVPRGTCAAGIDYAGVDPGALNEAAAGTADTGAAVLFAGKNNTLLAVGKVAAVNDASAVTIIKGDSRSITFGLAALVTQTPLSPLVATPVPDAYKVVPAFLTNPHHDTTKQLDGHIFNKTVAGTSPYPIEAVYTIGSSSSGFTFGAMSVSIIPIGAGVVVNAYPKFILPSGGIFEIGPNYADDFSGAVANITSLTTTFPTSGEIELELTPGTRAGIISFYFELPVVALTDVVITTPSVSQPASSPFHWFIRAGTDFNYLDVPNRTGASVLVYVAEDLTEFTPIIKLDYRSGLLVTFDPPAP